MRDKYPKPQINITALLTLIDPANTNPEINAFYKQWRSPRRVGTSSKLIYLTQNVYHNSISR
jgi:hypothetical protein